MHDLLWTFPLLMLASVMIGWAAEISAVYLSTGIALAILAWLQTSPEFAIEATIAWSRDSHLMLANFTGSLRLLIGLGWPMIFFIYWFSNRKKNELTIKDIELSEAFSIEAISLTLPVLYFLLIAIKGTWTFWDGILLCSLYIVYLWLLNRQRKYGVRTHLPEEDEGFVVKKILSLPKGGQIAVSIGIFIFGAVTLLKTAHPFVESLKVAAMGFGVSEFFFIQWVAPIASEFPEKVTAFSWARKASKVPMAIVNMLSSIVSQWTLLAGLVPIIYSISGNELAVVELTNFQRNEILLTVFQSGLAVLMLADLKITWYESIGIFTLWIIQFFEPHLREYLIPVYGLWIIAESIRLSRKPGECKAWIAAKKLLFRKKAA